MGTAGRDSAHLRSTPTENANAWPLSRQEQGIPEGLASHLPQDHRGPDFITVTGGELKDFQLTELNWLASVVQGLERNPSRRDGSQQGATFSPSTMLNLVSTIPADRAIRVIPAILVPHDVPIWPIPRRLRTSVNDYCLASDVRQLGTGSPSSDLHLRSTCLRNREGVRIRILPEEAQDERSPDDI